MMDTAIFQNALIALVLGFMIGLQREMNLLYEHRQKDFAGTRTFSLIGLCGYLCALINQSVPYFLLVMALVVGMMLLGAYILNRTPSEKGMTTEFSALIVFLSTILLAYGYTMFSVFVVITTLFLLQLKEKLHQYERIIEKKDLSAAILFLMMSGVILPLVPNKPIDPWGYINVHHIWLMVVLIAGISFLGYIAVRLVGSKHGIGIAGFLGGLASSTAVTLSLSRRSKETPTLFPSLSIGISLACSVMLIRILIETYIIHPAMAHTLLIPVCLSSVAGYGFLGYRYYASRKENVVQQTTFQNPFKLSEALILGLVFGVVIAMVKLTDQSFGTLGVYAVSFISGLGDTDAIALSLASLSKNDLDLSTATHALVLALVANSFVKVLLVFMIGTRRTFYGVGSYLLLSMSVFVGAYFLTCKGIL